VFNQKMRPFWDTFRQSTQFHWLLRLGELQQETWIRDGMLENEYQRV
jgi:hypothetical protein